MFCKVYKNLFNAKFRQKKEFLDLTAKKSFNLRESRVQLA